MDSTIAAVSRVGDEDAFAIDTTDDELERAAASDGANAITWMHCTYDWYCRF